MHTTLSWLCLVMSLLAMAPNNTARFDVAQGSVPAITATASHDSTHELVDAAADSDSTPAHTASDPMQFRSGTHLLRFTSEGYLVAGRDHLLRVNFVGAAAVAPIASIVADPSSAGAPATRNVQDAPPLDEVTYRNLWPGIDLRYDGGDGIVRSTYTLAPGAKTEAIRLDYNVPVTVTAAGSLALNLPVGALRETAPIAWQEIKGQRTSVGVAFHKHDNGELGFTVGEYDPALPLSIDPTLTWNTFLGGTGADEGDNIATDAAGNVYVIGRSFSTWGSPVRAFGGGFTDAFVARLDGTSGALVWNTFLGGTSSDRGFGIATGAAGDLYVTGYSSAAWGAPVRAHSGGDDAFVARLGAASGALVWHTFLGAAGQDQSLGIATDAAGSVYVTGFSAATWGAPARPHSGGSDAFVARLSAASGALAWNTFLGEASFDGGEGIAIGAAGNLYVTGISGATWGDPVRAHSGGNDAFVARLSAASGALAWNTFLGEAGYDFGGGIATDAAGNVYVAGFSGATWGVPVRPHGGGDDAFVAQLGAASGALVWNTFLGNAGLDQSSNIATDAAGNVFVSGLSGATWGVPVRAHSGGYDAFLARLSSASGALGSSTFLGGASDDFGGGIATDAAGNVFVAGTSTTTWSVPVQPFGGGTADAFVARLTAIDALVFRDGFEAP